MLIDLIFQSYLMNWFSWKILLIFLNPIITAYPSWILLTRLRSSTLRVLGSAIISWLDTNIHFDGSVNLSVSTTLFRTHCLTGFLLLLIQRSTNWLSVNFNFFLLLDWSNFLKIYPVYAFIAATGNSALGCK